LPPEQEARRLIGRFPTLLTSGGQRSETLQKQIEGHNYKKQPERKKGGQALNIGQNYCFRRKGNRGKIGRGNGAGVKEYGKKKRSTGKKKRGEANDLSSRLLRKKGLLKNVNARSGRALRGGGEDPSRLNPSESAA